LNTWQIEETTFDPKSLHVGETIYTIGNGYFGTRGSFEEGYPGSTEATLLWGVFDSVEISKEELANVPDWLTVRLTVNGEHVRLDRGTILEFRRTLDVQRALLQREVLWRGENGLTLRLRSERFASLVNEHCGALRYSLTVEQDLPEAVEIEFWATFNQAVGNNNLLHWEMVDQGKEEASFWLHSQTRHSFVQLVQSMRLNTTTEGFEQEVLDLAGGIRLYGRLQVGETLTVDKLVSMYTSLDDGEPQANALKDLGLERSYYTLLGQHEQAWQAFWQQADILLEGDDKSQQAIRYNLYQLRCNASAHNSRASIAAKGLTGFGYDGHVFYDTEIFMFPFFLYIQPLIARNLLLYRYRLLDGARKNAQLSGHKGAQYPWESASDGQETTPTIVPQQNDGKPGLVLNGLLEVHISADIAFAVWNYWQVTGDDAFMRDSGAEMLLSTALYWSSRATYNSEQKRYEIQDVIGPDEWHIHVNNSVYTNAMARWNLQTALSILDWLQNDAPARREELVARLDLNESTLQHWQEISSHMLILQDQKTSLFEQFEGFFKLEPFDQGPYAGRYSSYQALLGVDPLQTHQIVKQADVLLLLTLLKEQFDLETKSANWQYYYPITDHDYGSSLSSALHAILACELSLCDVAYDLFSEGVLVDLENRDADSARGIHLGSCGAAWQAVVFGFAGLRFTPSGYTTHPCWPKDWKRLAFNVQHKGQNVHVDLRREDT
jgi:trehalose/maltose hydrolase-like predicted phosphorylase